MNKEDIKQAAAEYRNDLLCDASLEVNYEENNYDAGYSDCIAEETPKAFAKGAEWRINSVWHGKELTPEEHKEILVKIVGDNGEVETWVEEYNNEYHALENSGIDWEEVLTWAYINDLLPTKGGAE